MFIVYYYIIVIVTILYYFYTCRQNWDVQTKQRYVIWKIWVIHLLPKQYSYWDPLKSFGKFPWWDNILELGLKFLMPYQSWLQGSDIGGMTDDIAAGYGYWTNSLIIFKNA